jgi:hypothetical protein
MLISGDVPRGSLCTTNTVSSLIEQLQYALGEGPCIDAYHQDRPVLEPDLAEPTRPRWLAFTGPAIEAGVRAIFGFPLQVGAGRIVVRIDSCNHVVGGAVLPPLPLTTADRQASPRPSR